MPKSKTVLKRGELGRVTDDVRLNQAFQLAHSTYRYDESARKIALEIVWEALRGVELRLTAQQEADRHEPQNPTKVRWNTAQWFQILIYCKSERYERRQEANDSGSLTQEDMIIRYIKYLILTTCRRNSFHISLGLNRLVYDYRAAESMAIYDFVFQDADSSTRKADAYYRARKNKLIEELARRFHRVLRISEGARGEKMFLRRDDSSQLATLVADYLTLFTPWETRCELPERLTTWTPVQALQASQESQIHSLIHPHCFSKIIAALEFDPLESRLALPKFFLRGGQSENAAPPGGSAASNDLTEEETAEIRKRIEEEEARRRKFVPRSLSVVLDGIERARLDLAQSNQLSLGEVEEEATLIEVIGSDEKGTLLLATHVLTSEGDDKNQSKEYSIVLKGGQRISLTISPNTDHAFWSSLSITYQETKVIRAFALWLRQVRHRLSGTRAMKSWANVPVLSPQLAILVLALIGGAALLYLGLRSGPGEHIAKQQPTPSSTDAGKPPVVGTSSTPQTNSSAERTPSPTLGSSDSTPSNRFKPGATTRAQTERAVTSLSKVERIFIESLGNDAFSQRVRQKLIEKVQAGGRLIIATSPNDADTAITGSARQEAVGTDENKAQAIEVGSVRIQLVNISGDIIWRTRSYRGTADELAARLTKELLEAIEKERGGRKK